MLKWVSLALALLKFVNGIISWAREREMITDAYDKAFADVAQAILRKTDAGKKIMERVDAMSADQVDAGLRDLEPK